MMRHPQNPYDSYIIEASAGAGKTYQLTRRFLNIVSAGASASTILTITFTVKAANEMKERIIHEASKLLYQKQRQSEFDQEMRLFYEDYIRTQEFDVPPPRSAQETACEILSCTQLLRVTTIDALFYDWFASFPWEANPFPDQMNTRSLPYEMIEGLGVEELNKTAWDHIFTNSSQETLQECLKVLDLDPEQGILGIEHKIFELFRHYTFLWQSEQERGHALLPYEIKESYSEEMFFADVEEDLRIIIGSLNKNENFLQALLKKQLKALFESRFFNQEGEVSGLFVRGKNRDKNLSNILRVDEALQKYLRIEKLTKMNKASTSLFALYKLWLQERERLKHKKGYVEFHDLAIGNYKLFHDEKGMGATWFIQKSFHHLMIDECQDTSFLQFSVFKKLIEELLSQSESILPNTVFLVGDKKQSIYGFREAEPEVLEHMSSLFAQFEKTCIPLHQSYRSAPVILNFVNELFTKQLDPNFPLHETAKKVEGLVIPDCGRVVIQNLEVDDSVEVEAEYLANYLKKALSGEIAHPVYEKASGTFRPLEASDCVILYRSSTNVEVFEDTLRAHGIPYLREEKKGFYTRREIQDVLSFFKLLCDPTDTVALLTYLRSPFANVPDQELIAVLEKTLETERREFAIVEEFAELKLRIEEYTKAMHSLSPSQLFFRHLEQHSRHLEQHSRHLEQHSRHLERSREISYMVDEIAYKNLLKLYENILNLENEGHHTLRSVLQELEKKQEENKEASASEQGQAVRLMTIHKAKGLEFPFVALIKSSESWYRMDRYWAKMNEERGLAYVGVQKERPKFDTRLQSILSTTERVLAEEAERLLYVALTRASQYLLITAHQNRGIDSSFYPLLLNCKQGVGSEDPETQGRRGFGGAREPSPPKISYVTRETGIPEVKIHSNSSKSLKLETLTEYNQLIQTEVWKEIFENVENHIEEYKIAHLENGKLNIEKCEVIQKNSGEILLLQWKEEDPEGDLKEFAFKKGYIKGMSKALKAMKKIHPEKEATGLIWFTKFDKPLRIH